MRIVFMGTPDFSVPVLEGLIENYNVVGVVTQPDKEIGRKKEIVFSPVKELALKNNIKVLQPVKIRKEYNDVLELKPDMIVTCAYGQIIPKEIINYPEYGCINVHGSLLPKLRGGAPIHHAIIDGYSETGITIMYMDEGMDSGDIISQRSIKIEDDYNVGVLWDKMSILGRELLLDTLPSIINKTNKRIKQNIDEVSYGYNITREEEHIDFNNNSINIYNKIRGLNPYPSSYAILDDKEIKIYKSIINKTKYNNKTCGEIVDISKDGIIVKTCDSSIIITEVKSFGKKKMDSLSYVNGIGKNNLIGKVFK